MLASPAFNITWLKLSRSLQIILLGAAVLISSATAAQTAGRTTSLKEIRERGIVMQEWENSCAAASVATVLTYGFRDPITERYAATRMLEKANAALVKSQGGFSLLDMKVFVESRGYKGSAYKGLAFDDLRVFHAPIVPISTKGYNHYVVFNGVSGNDVLIADPAFGNLKMSREDFADVWLEGMAFVITRPSLVAQAAPALTTPAQPSPSKSTPSKSPPPKSPPPKSTPPKSSPPKSPPSKTKPTAPLPPEPSKGAIAPPTAAAPAAPALPQEEVKKPAPTPAQSNAQARSETALRWALFEWSESWARGDFEQYSRAYSERFKTGRFITKAQWLKSRKSAVLNEPDVQIKLSDIQIKLGAKGLAEVTFRLYYSSRNLNKIYRKRLKMKLEDGKWRIQSEETLTR
jgi:uncharacterized protein